MKYVVLCLCVFVVACSSHGHDHSQIGHSHPEKEKSIKHLEVAKVTSMEDAQSIYLTETAKIKSIKNFDNADLQQLHIITYSLEQSVFYFIENLNGDQKQKAKDIAVIVEDIHINSERNRQPETKAHVIDYLEKSESFVLGFNQ